MALEEASDFLFVFYFSTTVKIDLKPLIRSELYPLNETSKVVVISMLKLRYPQLERRAAKEKQERDSADDRRNGKAGKGRRTMGSYTMLVRTCYQILFYFSHLSSIRVLLMFS